METNQGVGLCELYWSLEIFKILIPFVFNSFKCRDEGGECLHVHGPFLHNLNKKLKAKCVKVHYYVMFITLTMACNSAQGKYFTKCLNVEQLNFWKGQ